MDETQKVNSKRFAVPAERQNKSTSSIGGIASENENSPPVAYLKIIDWPRNEDSKKKCGRALQSCYAIEIGPNKIGRGDTCRITLPYWTVSHTHACIDVKDDLHTVRDCSSSNGTKRNQVILEPDVRYELFDGVRLTFADVEFSYHKKCVPASEISIQRGTSLNGSVSSSASNGVNKTPILQQFLRHEDSSDSNFSDAIDEFPKQSAVHESADKNKTRELKKRSLADESGESENVIAAGMFSAEAVVPDSECLHSEEHLMPGETTANEILQVEKLLSHIDPFDDRQSPPLIRIPEKPDILANDLYSAMISCEKLFANESAHVEKEANQRSLSEKARRKETEERSAYFSKDTNENCTRENREEVDDIFGPEGFMEKVSGDVTKNAEKATGHAESVAPRANKSVVESDDNLKKPSYAATKDVDGNLDHSDMSEDSLVGVFVGKKVHETSDKRSNSTSSSQWLDPSPLGPIVEAQTKSNRTSKNEDDLLKKWLSPEPIKRLRTYGKESTKSRLNFQKRLLALEKECAKSALTNSRKKRKLLNNDALVEPSAPSEFDFFGSQSNDIALSVPSRYSLVGKSIVKEKLENSDLKKDVTPRTEETGSNPAKKKARVPEDIAAVSKKETPTNINKGQRKESVKKTSEKATDKDKDKSVEADALTEKSSKKKPRSISFAQAESPTKTKNIRQKRKSKLNVEPLSPMANNAALKTDELSHKKRSENAQISKTSPTKIDSLSITPASESKQKKNKSLVTPIAAISSTSKVLDKRKSGRLPEKEEPTSQVDLDPITRKDTPEIAPKEVQVDVKTPLPSLPKRSQKRSSAAMLGIEEGSSPKRQSPRVAKLKAATPVAKMTPLKESASKSPNKQRPSNESGKRVLSNKRSKPTIRICFTQMTELPKEKVQSLRESVPKLGGEVIDDGSSCTHLVTSKFARSIKFMCAVAGGTPIVTPKWLEDSIKAGEFLDCDEYILKDEEMEKKYEFNLKRTLNTVRQNIGHPLLSDYVIYSTESVRPNRPEMKEIVLAAGGRFLEKLPSSTVNKLVVIAADADRKKADFAKAKKLSAKVVTMEFVFTGILTQKLDVNKYQFDASDCEANSKPKRLSLR